MSNANWYEPNLETMALGETSTGGFTQYDGYL